MWVVEVAEINSISLERVYLGKAIIRLEKIDDIITYWRNLETYY